MAEFNLVLATTIAVLTSFIPGFLLAYPLLRKTGLRFFEIMIFGFTIGVVLPPALLFFESLAGIGFSLGLVFTNIAILSVIGLVLIFKDGLPKGTFTFATDLDDISGKIDIDFKSIGLGLGLVNDINLLGALNNDGTINVALSKETQGFKISGTFTGHFTSTGTGKGTYSAQAVRTGWPKISFNDVWTAVKAP